MTLRDGAVTCLLIVKLHMFGLLSREPWLLCLEVPVTADLDVEVGDASSVTSPGRMAGMSSE